MSELKLGPIVEDGQVETLIDPEDHAHIHRFWDTFEQELTVELNPWRLRLFVSVRVIVSSDDRPVETSSEVKLELLDPRLQLPNGKPIDVAGIQAHGLRAESEISSFLAKETVIPLLDQWSLHWEIEPHELHEAFSNLVGELSGVVEGLIARSVKKLAAHTD